MIAKSMEQYVKGSSEIRKMFEEGARLARIYGSENVYDFSLGNPSIAPPEEIKNAIADIISTEEPVFLHGYMNNAGYEDVREEIAKDINKKHGTALNAENILMTVGAAGGLNVIFKTLLDPEDEVVVFAPYFGEYRSYVSNFGGRLVEIPANPPSFLPDMEKLKMAVNSKTKAVIINTPNNPTGVVYTEETIKQLAEVLEGKERELGTDIYLISDEPYRELVYDGVEVPYIPGFYHNTIVGYSFSKSLSLPGERIGYLVMPGTLSDYENLVSAAVTANRILGFVNAPSLQQRVIKRCLECSVDVEAYNRNRETLYEGMTGLGFECVKPQGAFYLFVKSPVSDERVFCEKAKEHRVLVVPGSSFGCSGYVRMAYCVKPEIINGALVQLKKVLEELK